MGDARPFVVLQWCDDPDILVVSCSACGEIDQGHNRTIMGRAAYRHSEQVHDGLVDREGWV